MKRKLLLIVMFSVLLGLSISAQWQPVGPYGGIVRCFDTIGTTIFAGTDGAGVLKSTNNGGSWTGISNGLTNLQVFSLAHSGTTIVAGTYGDGVFISTNYGNSWTAVNNGLTTLVINAVAISGTTIFAGTPAANGGMFVSTNNGANWTLANTGFPPSVYILSITVSGTTVYAGTGNGVFMSTNNGGNWVAINTGLTNLYINSVAVNGSTLFAGTGAGVFMSTNSGANWTLVHPSALVTSIVINGATIFAGWGTGISGGVDMSTNNGGTWTTAYNGLSVWSVGVNATTVFAGTDGDGVFSSADNGSNWAQTSVGINNINTPSILLASGTNIFAGAFLGGVFLTTNNGGVWTKVNTGLSNIAVQALATNGSTVFAGTSGTGGGVFSTTNNGSNWTLVNNGLTNNNVSSFAINGINTFAGTFGGGVFLSSNNGGLWTAVNTGLSNTSIQALTVKGSAVFAGTYYGGVFVSTNNGGLWSAVNTGLTNLNVNALATTGTKILAGTLGGVFSSNNNGSTWTAMNTGLTNLSVLSLATDGADIFAGTEGGGVFFSCDSGNTWTAINDGMFDFSVQSLAVSDSNVFAATHGGAVWKRPLPDFDLAITSQSANVTACAGSDTYFSVAATGVNISYQWQISTDGGTVFYNCFDGIDYSGVTTNTLTVIEVPSFFNGFQYHCVITTCGSAVISNLATLTVNEVPSLSTTNPPAVCFPNTVDITTTFTDLNSTIGTVSYWTDSAATIPLTLPTVVSVSGTYYIKKVTAGGCWDIESVKVIIRPLPGVNYTQSPSLVCINDSPLTLVGGSPAGGAYSGTGVTANTFNPSTAGSGIWNIVYSYTDVYTCSNTASQSIEVDLCTGIQSAIGSKESGLTIFPNPFSASVTLTGLESSANLLMYNALGAQVGSWRINTYSTILETGYLPCGIYLLQIKTQDGIVIKKIVKE